MADFLGPFSGHHFLQERVRPNCWASPLLDRNEAQKMVSVLGTAFGRLLSEPQIWGRQVVTDFGLSFGFGLGHRFSSLIPVPKCGRRLVSSQF